MILTNIFKGRRPRKSRTSAAARSLGAASLNIPRSNAISLTVDDLSFAATPVQLVQLGS